jgi:hypothetical protein
VSFRDHCRMWTRDIHQMRVESRNMECVKLGVFAIVCRHSVPRFPEFHADTGLVFRNRPLSRRTIWSDRKCWSLYKVLRK